MKITSNGSGRTLYNGVPENKTKTFGGLQEAIVRMINRTIIDKGCSIADGTGNRANRGLSREQIKN